MLNSGSVSRLDDRSPRARARWRSGLALGLAALVERHQRESARTSAAAVTAATRSGGGGSNGVRARARDRRALLRRSSGNAAPPGWRPGSRVHPRRARAASWRPMSRTAELAPRSRKLGSRSADVSAAGRTEAQSPWTSSARRARSIRGGAATHEGVPCVPSTVVIVGPRVPARTRATATSEAIQARSPSLLVDVDGLDLGAGEAAARVLGHSPA